MFDLSSPTTYIPTIFIIMVGIFISVLWKDARKNTHDNTWELPYFDVIELSMNYINRNINPDGRFQYRQNVDPEITYKNDVYNSLRHAGTLFTMYQYEKLGLETKFKDNRIISSKYFIDRYIRKLDDSKYVVVSLPEEEGINYHIAKSGAAGVALCALSNLYQEKEIDLPTLRGLGEFLLSMTDDEGNVWAYYNLETNEVDTNAEAIFYPGEAAAGLLNLYEIDPQQKWLNAVIKIIMNIVNTRKTMNLDIPFDHWSVYVIKELLFKLLVKDQNDVYDMRAYAEQMAIPVLSNQITNPKNSYFGALIDNIRPCSLGAIMEGLASIYFITENDQLKMILSKALSIGNYFLAKVQVKTGLNAGGLPNSANWVKPGVTPNASIIRIDNVGHVVLGWLRYQNILKITGKY